VEPIRSCSEGATMPTRARQVEAVRTVPSAGGARTVVTVRARLAAARRKPGFLRRAAAAAAVATLLALGGMALLLGPIANAADKGTVRVVVIGDSFTSGEGANPRTFQTREVPVNDGFGGTFNQQVVDPAHQSSTAPALRAIDQIRAQNPDVNIETTFVPVSGATRDSLYQTTNPGTPFEQAPQINAVKDADVVVLGIGGNDARFSDFARTILGSREATTEAAFPEFQARVQDPAFAQAQAQVYNDVRGLMNPNGTLIVTGYPQVLPDNVPTTNTPSPVSQQLISSREAQLANQFANDINTSVRNGVDIANQTQGPAIRFVDQTNALDGNRLFDAQEGVNGIRLDDRQSSFHPNDVGQQRLADVLQPHVDQAVRDTLVNQGVLPPQNADQQQQQQQNDQQQQQPGDQQQQQQPGDQQQPTDQQQQQPTDQPAVPPAGSAGDQQPGDQQQQPPADQQQQPPADQQPPTDPNANVVDPGFTPGGGSFGGGGATGDFSTGGQPTDAGTFTGGGGTSGGAGATGDFSGIGDQTATSNLASDLSGNSTDGFVDTGTADFSGAISDFSGGSSADFSGGGDFGGGGGDF
jgi:hypothetical protein